jgi:hypothetical protein
VHAAENRALRELWAFSTNLERHWASLADRVEDDEPRAAAALRDGAAASARVREAVRPAMARRGLYAEVMAETAGRFVAPRPSPVDAPLERNQALRFAVLDGQHVTTLLAYLARLAAADGDAELRAILDDGERELRTITGRVRSAAVGLGDRPDVAIKPVGAAAAHRVGYVVGAVGEWVDRQIGRRRGRDGD